MINALRPSALRMGGEALLIEDHLSGKNTCTILERAQERGQRSICVPVYRVYSANLE